MMLRACLLSAALLAPAAAAQDARSVVLRAHPATSDAVVTLGDLFENAGEAAETAVARAPEPGRRLSLDPAQVRRAAAAAGLSWANAADLPRVTVEREGRAVSSAELETLVATELFMRDGEAYEITLAGRGPGLFAPLGEDGGLELLDLRRDSATGLFRAEVRAWSGGPVTIIGGRADAVAEAPVLARPVSRGEVITAADITWSRVRADRAPADMIASEESIVGQEARRSLRAGEPLRAYDLKAPDAVLRGETVAVVYETGPLTLTARARALESAPEGAVARFMTLQSNRTIEAVVTGPGQARVGPGARRES